MYKNAIKIAVIGSENTGKSGLCNAIADKTIEKDYFSTIGIDFIVKYIDRSYGTMSISLWDLSGLDRFSDIVVPYISSSSILLYCYSCESFYTFKKMVSKYNKYKFTHNNKNIIVIVATKIDSDKKIKNFEKWGKEFANTHSLPFIQTSAYTKDGIQDITEICVPRVRIHCSNTEEYTKRQIVCNLPKPKKYGCTLM
jgi:small GTP-binding protein